jgi:hypothetical protein
MKVEVHYGVGRFIQERLGSDRGRELHLRCGEGIS